MNVLLVTQYFPPDLGGAATRNCNLVKGLALNGCNVTVITGFPHYPHGRIPNKYRSKPIETEWMGQIRVIRTFMPPIKSEHFLKRLLLLSSFAFSSLFALPWVRKVDAVWGGSWIPGLIYSKIKQAPLILDVCDLTIEDLPMLKLMDANSLILKIAARVYRLFYVKGDAVAPISKGYVQTIAKKYCVKEAKIQVVEVGVDELLFKDYGGPSALGERPFRVTYAGVLGVGYDFEQVFTAATILKNKGIDAEFIVHGSGECLELIRDRLKELNLTNVKLSDKLLGSREEVARLLSEADALILPLKDYGGPYPGIPSKLYEYQAVCKPVICCAVGEPAKYILKSNSGVVVPPENPSALAEAVIYLLSNPKICQVMGGNGRKYIEREVTIAAIGSKVKTLFKTLRNDKRALD